MNHRIRLGKVTAFVTRTNPVSSTGCELLVFRHPFGGLQLPAGTIEESEAPEAALRETWLDYFNRD